MKWAGIDDKERVRLILQHVIPHAMSDSFRVENGDIIVPRGQGPIDWPVAAWDDVANCWQTRDIGSNWLTSFDPLHDPNDGWLILDHLKPGRAGLDPQEDQNTFLTRATFVSLLENRMDRWWAWPKERFCTELCMAALRACGVQIEE